MTARIEITPNICFGKPRVSGTRIRVADVLELLEYGLSFKEITSDSYYPDLTDEDIKACVRFAIEAIETVKMRVPTEV